MTSVITSEAGATTAVAALPDWARPAWRDVSAAAGLRLVEASSSALPPLLYGDFDGDGKRDVAVLVVQVRTQRRGMVLLHRGATRTTRIGAGVSFGNGGDDFAWMNHWAVERATGAHADTLTR